jgi:thioredoxin 1
MVPSSIHRAVRLWTVPITITFARAHSSCWLRAPMLPVAGAGIASSSPNKARAGLDIDTPRPKYPVGSLTGSTPGYRVGMKVPSPEPTRAEVDATAGETVLEFGASWCGFCQAAEPYVAQALGERPTARHRWIEDGPGKPLGRSYRVKLWPTLIVLRGGREVARVVRPQSVDEIRAALARLSDAP